MPVPIPSSRKWPRASAFTARCQRQPSPCAAIRARGIGCPVSRATTTPSNCAVAGSRATSTPAISPSHASIATATRRLRGEVEPFSRRARLPGVVIALPRRWLLGDRVSREVQDIVSSSLHRACVRMSRRRSPWIEATTGWDRGAKNWRRPRSAGGRALAMVMLHMPTGRRESAEGSAGALPSWTNRP